MKNLFITLFLTVFTTNFISAQVFINNIDISTIDTLNIDAGDNISITKTGNNYNIEMIVIFENDTVDVLQQTYPTLPYIISFQFVQGNDYKIAFAYVLSGFNQQKYIILDINYPVSLNEQLPSITDFKLYPNPVVDVLNLEFNAEENNDIQIYNIAGQLIETINSSNGFNRITYNTVHLAKGFYIIKIGNVSQKLIVE